MALSKEKRKLLDRLRNPRFRPREGLFLLEGPRSVAEALEATVPLEIRFALASPRLARSAPGRHLRERIISSGLPFTEATDAELAEVAETETHQGVVMVAAEPPEPLGLMEGKEESRFLLLDGIQDPGNVGTLLRGAWAFGLAGAIAMDGTADPWGPRAVRAGAGAFAHLPVARLPWDEARAWLQTRNVPLLAADAGGEAVGGVRIPDPWALVIGNEGAGVREELLAEARRVLSIPLVRGADSLNAGMAGTVLLYALTSDHGMGAGG